MKTWLKCSIEDGMLPGEHAVEVDTTNAGPVSLFADDRVVRRVDSLLNVEVVESYESDILIRLPALPFEITSRYVRVDRENIVNA